MPNILLTRIDNRLVHGQVGVLWTKSIGANLIILVDDDVAKDPMQQKIMSLTAESSGVQIRFFSVVETAEKIWKASDAQKMFIVCRNPLTVLRLLENDVPLSNINVGNMHDTGSKRKITKRIYVDDVDIETFKKINSYPTASLFIQDVPGEPKEALPFLKEV